MKGLILFRSSVKHYKDINILYLKEALRTLIYFELLNLDFFFFTTLKTPHIFESEVALMEEENVSFLYMNVLHKVCSTFSTVTFFCKNQKTPP